MKKSHIAGIAMIAALLGNGCVTHFRHPRPISVLKNGADARVIQQLDSLLHEKAWVVQRSTTEFLCQKEVDYELGNLFLTLRIELTETELLLTYFGVYKMSSFLSYPGNIEYQALGVMHRGNFSSSERLYFDEDNCTVAVCSMIRSATNGIRKVNGIDVREWDGRGDAGEVLP